MTEPGRNGDIIGRGWGFPAAVTASGAVHLVGGEEELAAAIRMILSTTPGERVMRPEFGCEMWSLVFAPLTAGTLGLIEQSVRTALERWEPRIVLDRIVAVAQQEQGRVVIEIDYRSRASNDTRNLVYPFYTIPYEQNERENP
jgi:uncharacterized protein